MARSGTYQVLDPQAVQRLLDPDTLACLAPLLGQEASVSQIARQLKVSLRAVHYRLQQLLACGLIEVAREEQRAGRAVKYYRAVAPALFVPFGATDSADVEALWLATTLPLYRQLLQALARAARHRGHLLEDWGVWVQTDANGGLDLNLAPAQPPAQTRDPVGPAALLEWEELQLTAAQAQQLKAQLRALLASYQNERGPQTYLLGLGLAPTGEADGLG